MKPFLSRSKELTLTATLACVAWAASAPVNAAPKPIATNTAPAEPVIAQSVFVLPSAPPEGKDPFYPRSTRPYTTFVLAKTNNMPAPAIALTAELHLGGISGSADRPLAIINNRTFEVGEQGDVYTNVGRSRIRCLEIRADAVVVQIGGERRVLHLRSGI
jgi:hypothetical protein